MVLSMADKEPIVKAIRLTDIRKWAIICPKCQHTTITKGANKTHCSCGYCGTKTRVNYGEY